jgi:hypothetical protein
MRYFFLIAFYYIYYEKKRTRRIYKRHSFIKNREYRRFPIKEALISLFSHASGIVDLWGIFEEKR